MPTDYAEDQDLLSCGTVYWTKGMNRAQEISIRLITKDFLSLHRSGDIEL